MTDDKATALREAAERANAPEPSARLAWAKWEYRMRQFEDIANPPTILALLAERERLRGALEEAREGLAIAAGWARTKPDSERARTKIKRGLDAIRAALNPAKAARQALEATDDQ